MLNTLDMRDDKSKEVVNFVFNTMPFGIICLNRNMNMVYCNKEVAGIVWTTESSF
jgi:hypothetical protein